MSKKWRGGDLMSKPKYKWWSYVKACIRDYPRKCEELMDMQRQQTTPNYSPSGHGSEINRSTESAALRGLTGQSGREYMAVKTAIEVTGKYKNGQERLKFIDLIFWKRTHSLEGAAMACYVSPATGRTWHKEFIRLTASFMGFLDT